MKAKRIALVVPLIFTLGIIAFIGCSNDSLTSPVNQSINQGVPGDQINWVSWKPMVKEQINALAKKGRAGRMIRKRKGGTVGGNMTFGNKVEIPAGAVPSNTYITVEVLHVDGNEQCGAVVEFLPSMEFLLPVKITLSWKYLDFDGDPEALLIYWCDTTASFGKGEEYEWVLVPDPYTINYDNQTITFQIDHFTRYAWGL